MIEVEMCDEPLCVLAAKHPAGKHAERRMSMLACPHNVPNFGPDCPICDADAIVRRAQWSGEHMGRVT